MDYKTAKALSDLFVKQSSEQLEMLGEFEHADNHKDFLEVRSIIGKTLGALYIDALQPIFLAYPDLKPNNFP